MRFRDLVIASLAKADEEPGEEIFEDAVKNGINHAYMTVCTTIEPQLNTTTITVGDDMSLPSDFFSIVDVFAGNQQLSTNDYRRIGNKLKITNKDFSASGTELILDYYHFPKLLESDTDMPVISEPRQLILIDYGAYECLLLKRKYEAANSRLSAFMRAIGGAKSDS